jgi:multicomponent Na+:H+ antiporter subunit B
MIRESIILNSTTRFMITLLIMFSFYLLLRGHNLPGGGFVGGLVGGASFALYGIAFGVQAARNAVFLSPPQMMGWGLIAALLSGVPALLSNKPFLTGWWYHELSVPIIDKFNTPLLFDIGVYLIVAGVTLNIIFALSEADLQEN